MPDARTDMPRPSTSDATRPSGPAHRPGLFVVPASEAYLDEARDLARKTGGTLVALDGEEAEMEASAGTEKKTAAGTDIDANRPSGAKGRAAEMKNREAHGPDAVEATIRSGALPTDACALTVGAEGVCLTADGMTLAADFTRMEPRLKPARLAHEMVVRAAKIKGVPDALVVDATAGLGEDSLLLAAAGHRVVLFERDPAIAALLADGLRRGAQVSELAPVIARMRLIEGDSIEGLARIEEIAGARPDVVLLDPMFPARTKDARVKKKLQLLQRLEAPCDDEETLMDAAIGANPRKIVVKRPAKGPLLAGVKPSHTVAGKAIRFDVIVPPQS
jgi:16S rRNA (guanine1516-N2)-methyltransferase